MTFLPIVQRELCVAARKRSTGWIRTVTALFALLIGAGFLVISSVWGLGTVKFGSGLLTALSWPLLAMSLAAGLFFTADCLSEEKREGTLGFLFLTDLRGYDVVGGKLLATSLKGTYALLAVFPVLAVSLVMGGVTGAQLVRTSLALVNALFYSLTAGLAVSALSRQAQSAMGGTFLLIVLGCAAGPVADAILSLFTRASTPLWSLTSPAYVFWAAGAWGRSQYWAGLLASHLVAWVWFALASIWTPRTWKDRPRKERLASLFADHNLNPGISKRAVTRRRHLLALDPLVWLVFRERWQPVVAWCLAGVMGLAFAGFVVFLPSTMWFLWSQLNWMIVLILYLWTASLACRFPVDARRSGLLELLLVSPLSSQAIVDGQWLAAVRLLGFPVLLIILVEAAGTIFAQLATLGLMTPSGGGLFMPWSMAILSALLLSLTLAANLGAIVWFGMWTGLTSRSANLATLKTLLFVQLLPWFLISFLSSIGAGLLMFGRVLSNKAPANRIFMLFPLLMVGFSAVLHLAKDAAFIFWARKQLHSRFRTEVSMAGFGHPTRTFPLQAVPPKIAERVP